MTAIVNVRAAGQNYYGDTDSPYFWHFDVDSVAKALSIARTSYPDAPPLTAEMIIDCESGGCMTRLHIRRAVTVAEARALAAGHSGWFTLPKPGGGVKDCCQFHTLAGGAHLRGGDEAAREAATLF